MRRTETSAPAGAHDQTARNPSGYITWEAPGVPRVHLRRHAMEGIHNEVMQALASVPRRGAETGGVLLGRVGAAEAFIEDFEPVPSEHRFGPSYRLSPADLDLLRETVEWFRGGGHPGITVVGFYRSHTRPEFGFDAADEDVLRLHFRTDEPILLIRPSRLQGTVADFFFLVNGCAKEGGQPVSFPFQELPAGPAPDAPREAARRIEPERTADLLRAAVEPGWQAPPASRLPAAQEIEPAASLHAGAERKRAAEERSGLGWFWGSAAVLLAAVGGILAFIAWRPQTPPERTGVASARQTPNSAAHAAFPAARPEAASQQTAAEATPGAAVPAPPPAEAAAGETAKPKVEVPYAASEPRDPAREVRAVLDRWSHALQRGDARGAAALYTPRVTAYLDKRDVSREFVRKSILESIAANGRPEIHRISDVTVISAGKHQVIATLRKHWQYSGAQKIAGEEQDRLVLVRNGSGWQIASQLREKVFWRHSPPGG